MQRFVRDWFGAAYRKLHGRGPRADARAQADSDELLDILARPAYQAGHIRELCTNPLLLTILCIVFHEERKLPTGRAELYAHCVRVLLEYWRRDIYKSDLGTQLKAYDAEAAQAVLARRGVVDAPGAGPDRRPRWTSWPKKRGKDWPRFRRVPAWAATPASFWNGCGTKRAFWRWRARAAAAFCT